MDIAVVSVEARRVIGGSRELSRGIHEARVDLEAGKSYQIWVHSYYEPVEFEILATF